MASAEKIYRRTRAGDAAVRSGDLAVPTDYRRILALVEGDTHENVIRGHLRHYPDELIEEWIGELEELNMLMSKPAAAGAGEVGVVLPGAAGHAARRAEVDHEVPRLERETRAAGAQLSRTGAYLAEDRVKNRDPVTKAPADTVVLIVEDDPDQLALADLRVSMAGYQVRVAESAGAMLQTLRSHGLPDVVLLDVMLPDGDGFDILSSLRHHPRAALVPVIMLTAKTDPADIRRGLALGADGYITKPYSKNVLADTIRRVLVPTRSG